MAPSTLRRKQMPRGGRRASVAVARWPLALALLAAVLPRARPTAFVVDAASPASGPPGLLKMTTSPTAAAIEAGELSTVSPTSTATTPAPSTTPPSPAPSTAPPSPAPSAAPPTPPPTPAPTTKAPSPAPTGKPSAPPTPAPTTRAPSKQPTAKPTKKPTSQPTSQPTPQPSDKPTNKPSNPPTKRPSNPPTRLPTKQPTKMPTRLPTRFPTSEPTQMPTNQPNQRPTLKPTAQPSAAPTRRPTQIPTAPPTRAPTARPTTAEPSRSPSASPTTSEPTSEPTNSPTLSAAPSTSFDYCVRDQFGIEMIYSSSVDTSNNWYAEWKESRTLVGGSDQFDVDPLDALTGVQRNGIVVINDGVATLQRSPRLRIYAGEAGFGGDVEMTGYAKYLPGGSSRANAGINLAFQLAHPGTDPRCSVPSYRMQLSLDGKAGFQKEYRGGYSSTKSMVSIPGLGGSLPRDEWIGVKFLLRQLSASSVQLSVYVDFAGGADSSEQSWFPVHSIVDSPGSWTTSGDPLPDDDCSASLGDGAVFTGSALYGVIDNVGNAETQVSWRDVSIRGISSTTRALACSSESPTASPTIKTDAPSIAASSVPSVAPSVFTSKAPVLQAATEDADSTLVQGMLNFVLPFDRLLDDEEIEALEATVSELLQNRMSSREGLNFSDFNATVVSQAVVVDEPQSDASTNNQEPRERVLQEQNVLIVDTLVRAAATPADEAAGYPFQAVIHRIIEKNSDRFYEKLLASDAFADTLDLEIVDLESNGGSSDKKSVALGSSIAGLVMLIALALAFFILRRRHETEADDGAVDGDLPPVVCSVEQLEEGDADLSSLDDSFLEKYPGNVPHLILKGAPATATNADTAKAGPAELDNQTLDMWSVAAHSHTLPMKQVDLDSVCSAAASSVDHKTGAFASIDEDGAKPKSVQSEESVTTEEHEGIVDASTQNVVSAPAPKAPSSTSGLRVFSCFGGVDNTLESEQTLTTKAILGQNKYKSEATPKALKTLDMLANGNVYEVRAPPGGLGLIIDSSPKGPTIVEVKETSPFSGGLVEVGDIILTVDGVDVSMKDANALAHWIISKPVLPEQTLTLLGNREAGLDQSDADMSI